VARDRRGRGAGPASAFLRYLELRPDAPDAIPISQRIGQLQSLAIRAGPSPGAALALGMLVPGMGQFYSGRTLGGFAVLAAAGSALAAGFLFEEIHVRCLNPVEPGAACPPGEVVSTRTERPYLMLGVGAAAAAGVIGAVEAFIHLRGRRARAGSFPVGSSSSARGSGAILEGPSVTTGFGQFDLNVLRLRFR
jgi:hypothetical protein